jgi:alcohol dehydrogenase
MQTFRTVRHLSNGQIFRPPIRQALYSTMKALVYRSVGDVRLEERPVPKISQPTDAIVKLTKSTICGTDLHIKQGDVATCKTGTILGHEGVGIIQETGESVRGFKKGEHVLISCICSCATCEYCRKGMYSHCTTGGKNLPQGEVKMLTPAGWVLGNTIDGTQAEYVRIPHADSSLYPIPEGADEAALVMLSDIFPTGLECGVLNGKVQPGSTVVIVGAGPVGLAAMITSQLYSPSTIIMIDMDNNRLRVAKSLGAHHTIDPSDGKAAEAVKALTDGKGCDTVIEAVGVPEGFELCQNLVAPGGVIANVGVHGTKVDLHLENLWAQNIGRHIFLAENSR